MNRLLIYLFVILAFSACKEKNISHVQKEWFGVAMPQWLTGDTTILYVSDYFYKDGKFDSLQALEGLKVIRHPDSSWFKVIRTDREKHLFGLNFYKNGDVYQLVLKNRPTYRHTFRLKSTKPHKSVSVKGDFNGWSSAAHPLKDLGNAEYEVSVNMAPGEYGYQFVADGNSFLDPANPETRSNGMGGANSLLKARLEEPNLYLFTEEFKEDEITIGFSGKAGPILALWENQPLKAEIRDNKIIIKIPKSAGLQKRSFIRIYAANQFGHANDVLIPLESGKPLMEGKFTDRSDIERTVMYFVMVDRFFDGDRSNNHPLKDPTVLPKANYQGGDLRGILTQLKNGYFNDLGVNALWISPISRNPDNAWGQFKDPDTRFSGYHGYWPVSSSQVDYRFGDAEVLKQLLDEAHNRGISVYLDYVANHVHKDHPVYQKHPEWATSLYLPDGSLNTERWDDYRLTTWFDTFMPTLDLENQYVAEYMSDSALFWMRNYDFDGFRHDATKHIPESFWRIVTRKMKLTAAEKGRSRFYQIGETYGNPELISGYLGSGLLDAQFDFTLYDDMLPAFAYGESSFAPLINEQMRSLNYYGYHHLMGNISGNQDKPRFISYADGQLPRNLQGNEYKRMGWKDAIKGVANDTAYKRMWMMQSYLLTIPGIPVIYYGDEIGMAGAGDPDNRRMMKFEGLSAPEAQLKNHVKTLSEMRSKYLSLVYGDFKIEHSSDMVMAYSRRYFNEMAIVCINKSNVSEKVTIKLPKGFSRVRSYEISDGATIAFGKNEVNIVVPSLGSCVYIIDNNQK